MKITPPKIRIPPISEKEFEEREKRAKRQFKYDKENCGLLTNDTSLYPRLAWHTAASKVNWELWREVWEDYFDVTVLEQREIRIIDKAIACGFATNIEEVLNYYNQHMTWAEDNVS